jgi:ATP-dependent protease Clp ATPase subunit
MFEVPSRPEIKKCVITEKAILESSEPELYLEESLEELPPGETA